MPLLIWSILQNPDLLFKCSIWTIHNSSIISNQQHYCSTTVFMDRVKYKEPNPCLCWWQTRSSSWQSDIGVYAVYREWTVKLRSCVSSLDERTHVVKSRLIIYTHLFLTLLQNSFVELEWWEGEVELSLLLVSPMLQDCYPLLKLFSHTWRGVVYVPDLTKQLARIMNLSKDIRT